MALDSIIRGSTSGLGAEVNAQNHLKVTTETNVAANPGNVGAFRMFSENDAGSVTGEVYLQAPETSDDYRLRVGTDTLLFDHTFAETLVDTSAFKITNVAVMTSSLSNGFLTLNAGNATTAGNHIAYATQRHVRLRATAPLYVEATGNLTAIPITGQIIEVGLFVPTAGTQPQDGCWYQVTSAGVVGIVAYNGSITQSGILVPPESLPISTNGTYLILANQSYVEFWIDDILMGEIKVPAGQATPFLTDSLPFSIQQRNSGTVAGTGQSQIRVGDVSLICGDIATNKPWASQMAGMGQMGYQGQAGGTMGTTALLPNATAATTLTGTALSQTAAIATGLGGQAGITAGVAGLDGLVTAFQVPVGSVTQPPRNLTIKGIKISAVNIGAAVATTASIVQWSLGFGSTALSLATPEAQTVTAVSTKAYRRIPLGFSSFVVGSAIGAQAQDINISFDCPIVVFPGEFVSTVAKFIVGTATASQVIWCAITYDSHWD